MKKRLLNILFWSVISAAFIGPGTITTAAKSGTLFGNNLLWALVFSTFACLILQEAVARLAIHSGSNLGESIGMYFKRGSVKRVLALLLVVGAILVGSAAYEAGNIMGAVAGAGFIVNVKGAVPVFFIGFVTVVALTLPSIRKTAQLLGIAVAIMGISFLTTAFMLRPVLSDVFKGMIIPTIPDHSGGGLLVLGLIGTTVVPYNLFLGSGITSKEQSIKEMRFGLGIAIILGGIISMSVLVVGSFVPGEFSYSALIETLKLKLGVGAGIMFGAGMFAAGLTSSITAPLASAITAKSMFGNRNPEKWSNKSFNFRLTWGVVLLVGIIFGISGLKPVPVIILAQALNGFILPFISIFLVIVVNDPKIIGTKNLNGIVSNVFMMIIVWVTLILGMTNLIKVFTKLFPRLGFTGSKFTFLYIVISFAIWIYTLIVVIKNRKRNKIV